MGEAEQLVRLGVVGAEELAQIERRSRFRNQTKTTTKTRKANRPGVHGGVLASQAERWCFRVPPTIPKRASYQRGLLKGRHQVVTPFITRLAFAGFGHLQAIRRVVVTRCQRIVKPQVRDLNLYLKPALGTVYCSNDCSN